MNASTPARKRFPARALVLAAILIALLLAWGFFHQQIVRGISTQLLLNSKSPSEEFFTELAGQSSDPVAFLNRCWATGKVAHRELVMAFLEDNSQKNPSWYGRTGQLLEWAARDADNSVRELALGILRTRRSPLLFECAQAQLQDLDPSVRLLGLQYLRDADPRRATPVLMRLLDDPDPRIVAGAEAALARWTGQDYGVRVRMAAAADGDPTRLEPADAETIRLAVARRKLWWQAHAQDYPAEPKTPAPATISQAPRPPAPDFTLKDLAGNRVRLSDFRGKVVVLNFWATWCTACLAELPDLIALHNESGPRVAIVGVALDSQLDASLPDSGTDASQRRRSSVKAVRDKVARAVKARRINYTVLLDPSDGVGAQYNGGELPTTVIFGPAGCVRRRFIGERTVKVFQAMVAEAGKH